MIHVTDRAKEVLFEKKTHLPQADMALRLASSGGRLGLVADRVKAGDQVSQTLTRPCCSSIHRCPRSSSPARPSTAVRRQTAPCSSCCSRVDAPREPMGPRPGDELAQLARLGRAMAGRAAHFKLPYGIERAQLVPTARVLTEEFGFRLRAPVP